MCTTHVYVSHRRERCRKDETKAWSVMLEMKQREAGFVPQPAAAPVVPDTWQAARRTMCIAMTRGTHGSTYVRSRQYVYRHTQVVFAVFVAMFFPAGDLSVQFFVHGCGVQAAHLALSWEASLRPKATTLVRQSCP